MPDKPRTPVKSSVSTALIPVPTPAKAAAPVTPAPAKAPYIPEPDLTFEERYKETVMWVEKRRRRIDLANLEWADIRQLLLIRVSQQYSKYDRFKGPYKNWVNKVLTRAICSIWRDFYAKVARPCVTGKGGCVDNMGGTLCRRTPSGVQCSECPAYRDWEQRKGDHHNITLPLPLDNHSQEVHSKQSDFMDIEGKKAIIDRKMRERLTRAEWKLYKAIIIQHKSDAEASRIMGFKKKRGSNSKMPAGYAVILAARHRFVEIAREIIEAEHLA